MDPIIKIRNIDFQNFDLCLNDRTKDRDKHIFSKKFNREGIKETIEQVTEDHFTKLYEYIYLNAKPLTQKLAQITRHHFVTSSSQLPNRPPVKLTDTSYIPFVRPKKPARSLAPLRNKNKSMVEKKVDRSADEQNNITIIHPYNRSIQYIDQDEVVIKEQDHGKKNNNKHPRSPSIAELLDGPSKGSILRQVGSQNFSGARDSALISRDGTPRTKRPKAILSILNNPIFIEKHRGKVNKLKAEKLINCESPEFGRLIRRMTGDEKTVVVKLIKITREQLREHMLRKYPREITDKFIQVMDFPSTFDVKTYLEHFKGLLTENLDLPYFFCFELFDFNNDDIINHRDIFSLFKFSDQYPFLRNDYYKLVTRNEKTGLQKLAHLTQKHVLSKVSAARGSESSKERAGYVVNKNALNQQVNILKHVENMISKQDKHRLINLTQYKMVHQTELSSYLNYRRGKFKHKCLLELTTVFTGNNLPNPKKNSVEYPYSRTSLLSQNHLNTIMDDNNNKPEPPKKKQEIPGLLRDTAKELEMVASWGENGVNVLGFAEIFSDDMPHLFYDILYHCTLVSLPGYEHKFSSEEIFELYKQPISKNHNLGTIGTSDHINSKNIKTISSLHPDGIDTSFAKLSTEGNDDD